MIDEVSKKAIVEYERRTITPAVKDSMKRQLFKGKEIETEQGTATHRMEHEKGQEIELFDEASSKRGVARQAGISKQR
ncbi:UNVERIFIED_CONTAM: hypothetical protein Slati_3521100 [Sesamum latifolium]|uniref:Uncharacterized protein n=1 Tax=Sesamum latifolium TaxID=2727402 RepID=A0AAW2UIQ0_9LAMI